MKLTIDRFRVKRSLYWIPIVCLMLWGFKNTVSNGIRYQLQHGNFSGDFSSALFDATTGGWIDGYCVWPDNLSSPVVDGQFHRGVEILYGPIFTVLQHLFVDNTCSSGLLDGSPGLRSTPRVDVMEFLRVVTGINLILIAICVWLISKLLNSTGLGTTRSFSQITVIATLWLLDSHLSYSISVAAILEILELCLTLSAMAFLLNSSRSSQILSGSLIAVGTMIKVVPVIFAPLLFYRRAHTIQRLTALIGTILMISISVALVLKISIIKVIYKTFLPGQAGLAPSTHSEFRSLSGALARILNIESSSTAGTILGVSTLLAIGLSFLFAIMYTAKIRRRGWKSGGLEYPGLGLLVGLYCSLFPMINIAHLHTYVFLIPTYVFTYYAARSLFSARRATLILTAGGALYLWISQSLIAGAFTRLGKPVPVVEIFNEEALPNFGFTILIMVMICLYETQGKSGPVSEPGRTR